MNYHEALDLNGFFTDNCNPDVRVWVWHANLPDDQDNWPLDDAFYEDGWSTRVIAPDGSEVRIGEASELDAQGNPAPPGFGAMLERSGRRLLEEQARQQGGND